MSAPRHVAHLARPVALVCLMALASTSWAGRPLTVDDANVAEVGGGQLESWYSRPASRDKLWTTAFGVGVLDGLELGGAVERDFSGPATATALQAKLRLTPSREGGCNIGAVVGRAHFNRGGGQATYVNGLFTCNIEGGPLHVNLGANRADGGPTLKTWGAAKEFELGDVTAHVELFGQQHAKPTLQFGLRREVVKNVQVDGTLGRSDGKAVFSVGVRVGW
ncbi:hypothetical protein [Pseudorhodoferax sp. Leaf267]|uniref:hypothetical protein n=1 Tax=Pseudorhodoferax sp. Leaf267 TaxID=1736316 RepID=UPI0006F4644B|nr:hypothetical protein [Pseudorhodoferax sp. Leaf267]KQP22475.1 hypothetical protein ASF43_00650 [Pseudorhodoferax sp. Leaf267]